MSAGKEKFLDCFLVGFQQTKAVEMVREGEGDVECVLSLYGGRVSQCSVSSRF